MSAEPAALPPPHEFCSLSKAFDDLGLVELFDTFKAFEHHVDHVRDELAEARVLIFIGKRLFVHRERFWEAFVAAQELLRLGRVRARALTA